MAINFGSGNAYAVRTDIANATPVQLGILQDISVDFAFTNKELMGQNQFAVAIARAGGKITGKAKAAQINALTFNNFFVGQTITQSASNTVSANESGTIPAASTYTVTAANSATFYEDLGVTYAATGLSLTLVASAPATGQYAVSGSGVYTFAAADANLGVKLNYAYTQTTGKKIVASNQLMGQQSTFKLVLYGLFNGKALTLELNQCISSKLSLDFKNEDFTIPEFDFEAFADASGNLYTLSFAE